MQVASCLSQVFSTAIVLIALGRLPRKKHPNHPPCTQFGQLFHFWNSVEINLGNAQKKGVSSGKSFLMGQWIWSTAIKEQHRPNQSLPDLSDDCYADDRLGEAVKDKSKTKSLFPRSKPVQKGKWEGEVQVLGAGRCHLVRFLGAWKSRSLL